MKWNAHGTAIKTKKSVGLEFESERTAGVEMTVAMMLALAEQDIRENAQSIHNAESADDSVTRGSLVDFFGRMERLRSEFPWTFVLRCPMSRATIEGVDAADPQLTREEFLVPPEQMERVQAAFADIYFDEQDRREEEAAAAASNEQ